MEEKEIATLKEMPDDSKNIRTIKALYLALKSEDIESLSKILVDKPVWDVCPGFPYGKTYCGLSEIMGVFYQKIDALVSSFGALVDTFIDGGNTIVAIGHYKIVRHESPSPILVRFSHIWHIADNGRIKGVWQVADSSLFRCNKQI